MAVCLSVSWMVLLRSWIKCTSSWETGLHNFTECHWSLTPEMSGCLQRNGTAISFTPSLCTNWLPRLSRLGFAAPMIFHPSLVFCANGSLSWPTMTSRGTRAEGQSYPISSPTSQSWSDGNSFAKCLSWDHSKAVDVLAIQDMSTELKSCVYAFHNKIWFA